MISLLLAAQLTLAQPEPPPKVQLMPPPITMTVTKYTAGVESTGKAPGSPGYGITASGEQAKHGVTCAAGDSFPFGTVFLIEGHGFYVKHDTGGAIEDDCLDLFEDDLHAAIKFGRRKLNVWVIG